DDPDRLAARPRLLAEPAGDHPRAGCDLPGRLPGRPQSVSPAARRARLASRPALSQPGDLPAGPQSFSPSVLRPTPDGRRCAWHRPVGTDRRRADRRGAPARVDAGLVRALDALSVDRQYRADLLCLRLGIVAAGGWFSGDLPGAGRDGSAAGRDLDVPLVALPGGVRRRPDPAPRRSVLAGPHLPLPPSRDPADAQSAQLVLPQPAEAPP